VAWPYAPLENKPPISRASPTAIPPRPAVAQASLPATDMHSSQPVGQHPWPGPGAFKKVRELHGRPGRAWDMADRTSSTRTSGRVGRHFGRGRKLNWGGVPAEACRLLPHALGRHLPNHEARPPHLHAGRQCRMEAIHKGWAFWRSVAGAGWSRPVGGLIKPHVKSCPPPCLRRSWSGAPPRPAQTIAPSSMLRRPAVVAWTCHGHGGIGPATPQPGQRPALRGASPRQGVQPDRADMQARKRMCPGGPESLAQALVSRSSATIRSCNSCIGGPSPSSFGKQLGKSCRQPITQEYKIVAPAVARMR
jgi:hypothetical protein